MSLSLASWSVLGLGLLGWVALVALARRSDGGDVDQPTLRPVPDASMRVVFLSVSPTCAVLDGLLDVADAPVGVPTGWTLALPHDPVFRVATIMLLERWIGDAVEPAVDLTRLWDSRPSLALSHGDELVRLAVAGPSPLLGDGLAQRER